MAVVAATATIWPIARLTGFPTKMVGVFASAARHEVAAGGFLD